MYFTAFHELYRSQASEARLQFKGNFEVTAEIMVAVQYVDF